jgi:WD40 repeat protein
MSTEPNILICNFFDSPSAGDLWDARTFQHIRSLSLGQIPENEWNNYVSISPDGAFAATVNTNGTMYIWDLAKRSLLRSTHWNDHFIAGG